MADPDELRARVAGSLRSIASGEFEPAPGAHCAYCDFRAFCAEGRAFLEASDSVSSR